MMEKICSIQEFVLQITNQISKLSPEQKREFRQAWLDQVAAKQNESDRRFLRSVGIDPDGD